MRVHHMLLCLRIFMVFFCIWVLVCGAIMASHYSYGSRETLIIAIILDALLMVFCIFLIVDVLKRYYLQFPVRVALSVIRKTKITKIYGKVKSKPDPYVTVVTKLVESGALDWLDAFYNFILSFHLTYITLIAIIIAGIVAWMITASATIDILATLTIGNSWHTVTCLMMDSMTQLYATSPGQLFHTQTSSTQTRNGNVIV